jgi:hypothetical protein
MIVSFLKVGSYSTMPSEIADRELKRPVDVAEYLFTRLHQLGIRSVHGVPGIYILNAFHMAEF